MCDELDQLLQRHSTLTLEFMRQDERTQGFYASDREWAAECARLRELEHQLSRATADIVSHRRLHGCVERPDPLSTDAANEQTRAGAPS